MTDEAMERALVALEGLSLGDGFGERFFGADAAQRVAARQLPAAPWGTTDDTEMATVICDHLRRVGRIDQDELAPAFARRWARDPGRGYGGGAASLLGALASGVPWRPAAATLFDGQGSCGNGGAMRAAPIGAYFADDAEAVVREARAAAEVTHAHPEGQAGAIAVAAAAAFAWLRPRASETLTGTQLMGYAEMLTPAGATRRGLRRAQELGWVPATEAAAALGSGGRVLAEDTVPFALWCAARCLDNFVEAMWTTVAGLGDRDTTCAIVGGIVAVSVGRAGLPAAWLAAREPLRHEP